MVASVMILVCASRFLLQVHASTEDASHPSRKMDEDEAGTTETDEISSVVNKCTLDAALADHDDEEGLPEQRRKWRTVEGS